MVMMATNWGVFEFGQRDPQFRDTWDVRDMQIRARSDEHLNALRRSFPALGPNVYLGDGVADFQWRVYITRADLAEMVAEVVTQIDYIRFKEGAAKDHKLHGVLSAMWSILLTAYPKGSSYSQAPVQNRSKHEKRRKPKMWWEV